VIPFAADENFDGTIVRGVLRRDPMVDIARVQDVGLAGADDPRVLEWAAGEGRVLLTHDVATVTHFAYARVREGKPMPGVVEVGATVAVGRAIEDILLMAECGIENELEGQVVYLPLR
jgi:predicted nuclease of predicted toxin-antitoxin system